MVSKKADIAVCGNHLTTTGNHMPYIRSHSVTCHPAAVTFPPLPQLKLVLSLATPEEYKAELTLVVVISQDSLPANDSHLSQNKLGSVMAGN